MNAKWLHTMDEDGKTPLDRAFSSGHMAIAEMMLHQEREEQATASQTAQPLHRAACLGLTEAVVSLLTYGANPTARDRMGETPLHKAVREGYLATVEALVEVSDLNIRSNAGMAPLHWACITGQVEMVRLLLENGADPCLRNEAMDGLTPVDLAALMGFEEICELLDQRPCFV